MRELLPQLAVYLGHVRPEEMFWYLTATPELLTAASERFQRYSAGLWWLSGTCAPLGREVTSTGGWVRQSAEGGENTIPYILWSALRSKPFALPLRGYVRGSSFSGFSGGAL